MTSPRVGKKELATETPPASRAAGATGKGNLVTALARALASPYGVLIVFPGIVLCVGLFLTWAGQRALRASNVELGQHRLSAQAQVVAAHLRGSLEAADPMLDRVSDFALLHDSSKPLEPAAAMLFDVMQGRAGVAYASVSFTDGTFEGAYVDRDGVTRFEECRIEPTRTRVRRYDYQGHAKLSLRTEESNAYDPREREFYKQALLARDRIWTKPYPFYGTHYTGVTRAAPVYLQVDGQPRLHAVVTVDFDVNELSRYLRAGELTDTRTLLFTRDGTLLAYPQAAARILSLPLSLTQTLSYRDLKDPTLDAFFSAQTQTQAATDARVFAFKSGETPLLAATVPVSPDPALGWTVAYLVPEAVFFDSLRTFSRRSYATGAIAVLVALLVSVGFARLVVRVRREAAEARAEATRARKQARELGSYRLVRCLGKGGMGEVWRAEHRLLAREAAIKLIRHDSGAPSTAEAQERFRREAQTLAALRSRNTIELFDYGVSSDGTFFYVMELLDGMDLENLVHKYGPQSPGRVLRLLMQMCRSLGEAHDVSLVHRDIKPANLFICRAADEVDLVKVLDFGLVRALAGDTPDAPPLSTQAVLESTQAAGGDVPSDGALTRVGTVMGTPEFMAPEQALGKSLDGRADLYALGCVGYWLLTGELVFKKPTPMMTLIAHINEPPVSVEQRATCVVPHALKLCVMDCLAKSPEHRPQTARALLERLRAAEQELPAEERWTEQRAQAWWREHRPATRASVPVDLSPSPPGELRIGDGTGI